MTIYSALFFAFMAITLVCYYTIFRRIQWLCLLVASMAFYACFGAIGLVFICVTGFSTWLGAFLLMKTNVLWKRRILFWGVLVLNFGILAYLKYWNVIFQTSKGLLLPLGISFYMFQSMGYLIDVANEKYEAQKNPIKFMLFTSFFPQLIQGPINRYDELGEQLYGKHSFKVENIKRGAYLFGFGMLKKYAIANILSVPVTLVLENEYSTTYPGCIIGLGILMYAIYQYADFSGGIDMVLGVAKMFDIDMVPNFNQPYFATSLADFWRRWHISLGRWMKDYVFYPFVLTAPMRKFGKWARKNMSKHLARVLPAVIGNLLVFFLVGIWHGPELHFVAWGLYNGIIIGLGDLLSPSMSKLNQLLHINPNSKEMHVFRILRTFFIVNVGGFFDRVADFGTSLTLMKNFFFHFRPQAFTFYYGMIAQDNYPTFVLLVLFMAMAFVFVVSVLKERKYDIYDFLHGHSLVLRFGVYYFVIFVTLLSFVCGSSDGGFMYANY